MLGGRQEGPLSPSAQVFFFKSFMHLARNVFRGLPCRPLASACFEHSIDSALRAFVSAFAFGVVVAGALAGGGAVEGVVCAIAAPAHNELTIATMTSVRI